MYCAYEKRGQTFQNSDLTYLKVACLVNQTVIESDSGTARFMRPVISKDISQTEDLEYEFVPSL